MTNSIPDGSASRDGFQSAVLMPVNKHSIMGALCTAIFMPMSCTLKPRIVSTLCSNPTSKVSGTLSGPIRAPNNYPKHSKHRQRIRYKIQIMSPFAINKNLSPLHSPHISCWEGNCLASCSNRKAWSKPESALMPCKHGFSSLSQRMFPVVLWALPPSLAYLQ